MEPERATRTRQAYGSASANLNDQQLVRDHRLR